MEGLILLCMQVLLTDVRFCHAFFQLSPVMSDMAHADKVHWYAIWQPVHWASWLAGWLAHSVEGCCSSHVQLAV